MRTQVSAIALATALLATTPAMAQLSLGGNGSGGLGINVGGDNGLSVNLGGSGSGGGAGVDAGVSLGGSNGLNVDAGVGVGGSSGLDVNAGAGLGGSDGVNVGAGVGVGGDTGLDVGVDAGVGGDGGIDVGVDAGLGGDTGLDADVNLGVGGSQAVGVDVNAGGATGPNGGRLIDIGSPDEVVDVEVGPAAGGQAVGARIGALGDAARVEALIGQIGDPQLDGIDLDAIIDDRLVSIVSAADLLGEDALAEVTLALDENPDGRGELLDAIGASDVLSSILGSEGIAVEDVLSVAVDEDGAAEIVVLPNTGEGSGEIGVGGLLGEDGLLGLTETELAELDIDLLSDAEVAELDLALLPNEEQRVDAVLRVLSPTGPAEGDPEGTLRIVDLNAFLGEEALGTVTDALGGGETPVLDAEVLASLEALGIDPEAVVAIGTDAAGNDRVFVDTSLLLAGGEGGSLLGDGDGIDPLAGLTDTELAELDIGTLTDEELALADLTLLPEEEQRVNAVVRLLGRGTAPQPGEVPADAADDLEIIDLDALLGDDSLADLSAVLDNDDDTLELTLGADALGLLDDAGIDPETVAAVRLGNDQTLRVFIAPSSAGGEDTGTGGTGTGGSGTGTGGTGTGTGGTGGTGTSGTGSGTGGTGSGTDTGGTGAGTGSGTGSGTGNGAGTSGNGGSGGTSGGSGSAGGNSGSPVTGGDAAGSDDGDADSNDGTGTPGTAGGGTAAQGNAGAGSTPVASANGGVAASAGTGIGRSSGGGTSTTGGSGVALFAELDCAVGLANLVADGDVSASEIADADRLELVRLFGCEQTLSAEDVAEVRAAIDSNADLGATLEAVGISVDEVIGATVSDDVLTVYVEPEPVA